MSEQSEAWLWEPTMQLRWINGIRWAGFIAPPKGERVLQQLWRGRRGHLFDEDFEVREEWRDVPVVNMTDGDR